ncbi:hypothetical protein AVEN_262514-1 [Araneus ventricosus]|uniref:Uncharacterized protein n=1 Tax=Araneus ventricosus TaxID=182803 RepID=A0A4Y2HZD1_ARAVE|nr:hypothetical protein AVEN_262514-1 [Araneus ventricosus]
MPRPRDKKTESCQLFALPPKFAIFAPYHAGNEKNIPPAFYGPSNELILHLSDAKDELKKTSSALVETAKEVRTLIDQPRPSYTEVLRSSPVALSNAPVISKRDNHVVLLRPVKPSTSEENIKIIENVLTARNSAIRISRIGKVSQGGLIIEAPTEADLQALEAEIGCLPKLEERFTV